MLRLIMLRSREFLLAGLAVTAPALALAADGLDVKTGAWETTVTTDMQGGPPMPPSVLAKMSAEQRAKMLEAAKRAAARGPTTHVYKNCVTPQDLKDGAFKADDDDDDKQCTRKVVAQSRTMQQVTMSCGGEMPRTAQMRMEAIDREHMKGSIDTTAGRSRFTAQVSARWIGKDCKGVDD